MAAENATANIDLVTERAGRMIGAKATRTSGPAMDLRHRLVETPVEMIRAYAARKRAAELAGITWTEGGRDLDGDRDRATREIGLTPNRWVRLT